MPTWGCKDCNYTGVHENLCEYCSGSGEGMTDGSRCYHCKGKGVVIRNCEDCNQLPDYWCDDE